MLEETYRVRQFNELKMQQDLQLINSLQKSLNESNDQTNKMTNLLDNFENRLTAMHDLIMPVYEATNILQIKYANLQKTSTQLDSIIDYYDSVKNLSVAIQAGPGKDIKNYISHLNKLKSAIEYFTVNKNQSQKTQNEELWKQGKLNVEREFDQLLSIFLNSNSNSINSIDVNFETMTVEQIYNLVKLNIKETEFEQMLSILQWFKKVEPSYLDKLYEKIIRTHSDFILEKIKNIKDSKINTLANSSSLTSSNLLSAASTGGANGHQTMRFSQSNSSANLALHNNMSFTDDKKNTLRSRLTDKSRRISKGVSSTSELQNLAVPLMNKVQDHDFDITDSAKFIQSVKKALIMFIIENKFMIKLFDFEKERTIACKIIERIYDPILKYLIIEAEILANNTKQINKKCTSKYLIAMFGALCDLVLMKQHFLKLFEQTTLLTKTTRHISTSTQSFLEIFIAIERGCSQSLKEIIEEIKQDPPTIQPNGNIHPITTETITFIENLLKFDVIAGFIANCVVGENQNQMLPSEVETNLRREASKQNESKFAQIAYKMDSDSDKLIYRTTLAEYFYKLFRWLNLNLKNKAEQYDDQNLKWIFLLNNSYKMSKLFADSNNYMLKKQITGKCKNLNELFALTGKRDLKTFYDNEILNYKREYSKCWSKLLLYIKDFNETNPFPDQRLKDKDRQLLKDRFSGFNKEFEEIYEAQKKYYIPSEQSELAQMLREDNVVYIVGQYKKFYEIYARLNFATNKEKYVKYSPELLGARIREFFTAY